MDYDLGLFEPRLMPDTILGLHIWAGHRRELTLSLWAPSPNS
jgi:hypothetical protein